MRNLSADVAALFSELDGRDRYEERLAMWCEYKLEAESEHKRDHWVRADERAYQRTYRRTRYQSDPVFRDKVRRRNNEWRWKYGAKPRTLGPVAIQHGTYYAYTKRKCRCGACRDASATYMRDRRTRIARAA